MAVGLHFPARTVQAFQKERELLSKIRVAKARKARVDQNLPPRPGADGRAGPESSGSAFRLLCKLKFPLDVESGVGRAATKRMPEERRREAAFRKRTFVFRSTKGSLSDAAAGS